MNRILEIFHIAFEKQSWLCPTPDLQPCQPALASCCPLQHLLSVKRPYSLFLTSSSSSKRGLAGYLSLLTLPGLSSPFLLCPDYLHTFFFSSENRQPSWLALFPFAPNLVIWKQEHGSIWEVKAYFGHHRNHVLCFWKSLVIEFPYILLFQDPLSPTRGIYGAS